MAKETEKVTVFDTMYSTFTLTLGDQNATNSTGNQILVSIGLASGDSITQLSIA